MSQAKGRDMAGNLAGENRYAAVPRNDNAPRVRPASIARPDHALHLAS